MGRYIRHLSCAVLVLALLGCKPVGDSSGSALSEINHTQMLELVQEQDWLLPDVRDSNWFNDWSSPDTGVVGRIAGARSFDFGRLTAEQGDLDEAMLKRLFASKGMQEAPGLVVYGKYLYICGHSGTDPYNMQDYLNPDNTLRDPRDIPCYWQPFDLQPDTVMAFYCGTGWRVSLSWFAAVIMGFENAVVYDGGRYEWSEDAARPRETG